MFPKVLRYFFPSFSAATPHILVFRRRPNDILQPEFYATLSSASKTVWGQGSSLPRPWLVIHSMVFLTAVGERWNFLLHWFLIGALPGPHEDNVLGVILKEDPFLRCSRRFSIFHTLLLCFLHIPYLFSQLLSAIFNSFFILICAYYWFRLGKRAYTKMMFAKVAWFYTTTLCYTASLPCVSVTYTWQVARRH